MDAAITYACAKYLGLSPELAGAGLHCRDDREFHSNRSMTFRHSPGPLIRSFVRYWLVASAGLAVNYAVYSACVLFAPGVGIVVRPAILPIFVAAAAARRWF